MVEFTPAGRMGNYLFELSTVISYALEHNLDFTAPNRTDNPKWNPIYCPHLINKGYNPYLEKIHIWENKHSYEPLPFDESWRDKNICIEGYRQSAKYFDKNRSELLYLLDFPYGKKEGYVSIHVRRGDYLTLVEKHPEVSIDWYYRAMSEFEGFTFKFFSDEISWCMANFSHLPNVEFSSNSDEETDLVEMSCCEHQICSASTFSWWAAYLNRNNDKKVIFPELWFTPNWMGLDTSDIIKPEWIKIK